MTEPTALHDVWTSDTTAIIGGGTIGLSIAWRLAQQGRPVVLLERQPSVGRGASWAAAGMLAPVAEVDFVEQELLTLKRDSMERYPSFVAELEEASGRSVGYRDEGTLVVAIDRDDAEDLRHLYNYQRELGLPVSWLDGDQAREHEPYLSPYIQAAVEVASDHQIDNLLLLAALEEAAKRAGAHIITGIEVTTVHCSSDRVSALSVQPTGQSGASMTLPCQTVVLAAGCWSRQLDGLGAHSPPVRPVKGQIMGVRMTPETVLSKVVRAPDCYMVPRSDGLLIIGATSEEKGFDETLTAGGLFDLLRGAYETLPVVYELPVVYTRVGLRPGSLDNAPILGHTSVAGLCMATGHFRNGILLTPITADLVTQALVEGHNPNALKPFQLDRF
ncbi:MAG: glycine oxidase ThiO [Myxococcota bacterium]